MFMDGWTLFWWDCNFINNIQKTDLKTQQEE